MRNVREPIHRAFHCRGILLIQRVLERDIPCQFGKALGELFVGQQPRTIQTDPRTEYQRAVETRNVSLQDALNKQYTSAMEGPMYGLPDIPHQRYMEGELIDAG